MADRSRFLVLAFLVACGSSGGGGDAEPDVDSDEDATADVATDPSEEPAPGCNVPDAFERGGEGMSPLTPGGARAGRIDEADLPEDPTGLNHWEGGDFLLANDQVAVLIEDVGPSDGYDPWGGKPVGIFRVEDGALVEPADFGELLFGFGRYTLETTHVGVLDSDDGTAVVRAVGQLRAIPFIDRFAELLFPRDFDGVEAAIDYRLPPGAEAVDIVVHVRSVFPRDTDFPQTLLAFQRERMDAFMADEGFELESDVPRIAFVKNGQTSYALSDPRGSMNLALEVSGTMVFFASETTVAGCAEASTDFMRMYIGGPSLTGLQESIARTESQPVTRIEGNVRSESGTPLEGVRVHATSGERYLGRSLSDAAGAFAIATPEGVTPITLTTFDRRYASVSAEFAANPVELQIPDAATLRVQVEEGGIAAPARVQIRDAAFAPPPASFGEAPRPSGRRDVHFVVGEGEFTVPAGPIRVVVTRGFGYEIGLDETIDFAASGTEDRLVDLEPAGLSGLCADYHIHTQRSPDSPDPAGFKARAAAGDGLEIAMRSDHEYVIRWGDAIENEGLSDWLFGITSLELTTFDWGHFGVFPLEPSDLPNGGATIWTYRPPAEVFAEVLGLSTNPTLIVNHPRSNGGQGYFATAGYDPATGLATREELWDDSFQAIEVFNDGTFDESLDIVEDWFSFLNRGRNIVAVGSSDSHRVLRGNPVGYPRTCLAIDGEVAALRDGGGRSLVQQQTEEGRFYVSGGLGLDVRAGDARPGDTVNGAGPMASIEAEVTGASWIDADRIELFVDGVKVDEAIIEPSRDLSRGTFRFDVPV
ncbi:MAG: CehA/McbA family metallohydrolase, partial [Myxococcota bacterium]